MEALETCTCGSAGEWVDVVGGDLIYDGPERRVGSSSRREQEQTRGGGSGQQSKSRPRWKSTNSRKSSGRFVGASAINGQERISVLSTTAASSSRMMMMMEESTNLIDRALSQHEPQQQQRQRSSKLIVYEWDPMYLLAATTLTQGFDLVHYNLISEPAAALAAAPPPSTLRPQGPTIQEHQSNNCCPSLYAPGTHSLLLQESSS